ncbi:hypothetical protein GQ55_7G336000 [Panicum hallii var. hallii]|jgi:hypothetical protein|uniref:Uncharacterized protein n=1 Tax=Panicum hallii var. hallii TaxID=1504633 RepID=A0A2T7D1Y9_9POAL|nr:hypothetical protein GQ55_7G336000 [Panicum hallii var. hallii]
MIAVHHLILYDAFDCMLFRESDGKFQYGMYSKEADNLHSVVSYLYWEKYDVAALVGHNKYGFNHRLIYYNPGIHYLCY